MWIGDFPIQIIGYKYIQDLEVGPLGLENLRKMPY
jgi:hypothetical protein